MTTPTLTCDRCDSEIEVEKDPRCVVYDPSGSTDVICEACRKRAYQSSQEAALEHWSPYRIGRGWRA